MPPAASKPPAGSRPAPATTLTIALTADQRDAILRATKRDVQLMRMSVDEIEGAVAVVRPAPIARPTAPRSARRTTAARSSGAAIA
ncbi:MAG: hypothetical protein OER21_14395 [Gemmatimonadota bacterium]|nr:hypothetical protein [Gemmatimonadota bacterium]